MNGIIANGTPAAGTGITPSGNTTNGKTNGGAGSTYNPANYTTGNPNFAPSATVLANVSNNANCLNLPGQLRSDPSPPSGRHS